MTATQRDSILLALETVLGSDVGLAVIHSSLAALAPDGGLRKWDVLYAIEMLVRRGWTLAFPAFTFSFTRSGQFDRESTPSEVGVLADWVQQDLIGAIRTDHPIYSFVSVGPQATALAACQSKTTFGDTSPFGVFEANNARIVMLGAGWNFCTPFHRYEELAKVPYRLFKTFDGTITRQGDTAPTSAAMYVRDLTINAENDFTPLVYQLRKAEHITAAPLWRGVVEATNMQAIKSSAEALLASDPFAFVGNAPQAQYRMEMAAEAARLSPFRIALLGSSNLDIASHTLDEALRGLMPGRNCTLYVAPFGQMNQQIVLPGSDLETFEADLTIFADRIEDLTGRPTLDLVPLDTAIEAVEFYVTLIHQHATRNANPCVVHRFAATTRHNVERGREITALVANCNNLLNEVLSDLPNILWVDVATEAAAQVGPVWDARIWHLGRIPFSIPFTERLVTRWAGITLSLLGKTARLLVLDLDNTLWGGVLGEDGPDGILIGGDFPGNAFGQFQQTIKALSERGVALAVCSKNDEDLALDVLQNHAAMLIRPDDLASYRINWQPKWQNMRDIAAELDLGLGSVMFIDDNPVEREAVKRNLPMVKVLGLPQDPTAYTEALLSSPFVETLQTGKEDRKRVASYKARQKINLERNASANITDFLRGLKMKLHVQPLDDDNIARAAQLCQKTNQFNTTTRRYSAQDLKSHVANGWDVAVIGLADKFTEPENIGLILLRPNAHNNDGHIDMFLMSCRVLGRTVERAILEWAVARAGLRGWDQLHGEIVDTPRNTPVRNVFADHGFEASDKAGHWHRDTTQATIPDCFDVMDGFDVTKTRDQT